MAASGGGEKKKRRKATAKGEEAPAEAEEASAAEVPAKAGRSRGRTKQRWNKKNCKTREAAAEGAAPAAAKEREGKTSKKGKKRKADAEEAGEAEAEAGTEATKPKGSGNSRSEKISRARQAQRQKVKETLSADASEWNTEEALEARKEIQRQITALCVRLRGEGKSEEEVQEEKHALRRRLEPLSKPDGNRMVKKKAWNEWVNTDQGKAKLDHHKKQKLLRQHELVVIPVMWRGRHDHQFVQAAAVDVKELVSQQGVDVWLDTRRHLTPGQKFAHWEYRGVMLRVEIGPEDLKAGKCQVCLATTPGDYKTVKKKHVRLPPAGARALLLTLKEWGLSKIDVERRPGEVDSDLEDEGEAPVSVKPEAVEAALKKKAAKPKKVLTKQEAAQDDLEGNWEPAVPEAAVKEKKKKDGPKYKQKNLS